MNNCDLEDRISQIEADNKSIMEAMRGDLKGNSGMLQNLVRMMNDMYQAPNGVIPRQDRMEMALMRKEERQAGVVWAGRVIWFVCGGLIGFVVFVITIGVQLWKMKAHVP